MFSYKDCRFKVEPYKLGTGRVVAWKQFSITHSFTLESSFYGYDFGEDQHKLFTHKEYQEVGVKLCQSIFDLHFLWKSIRNELKLTNGWLKPRKLIEITGVPAAQLLNEELLKKKKEDQKKKAIEMYEQFLKKFYNKQDILSIQLGRRTSKNFQLLPIQNFQFKSEQVIPNAQGKGQKGQQQLSTIAHHHNTLKATNENQKSRNREMMQTNSDSFHNTSDPHRPSSQAFPEGDMDQLYKLLTGLVKIQARIRGYLTRKKFKFMIPKVRIVKNSKRQSIEGITSPDMDQDLIHPMRNQQLPQNTVDDMIDSINWRQYFQEQELEEAYHVVEVEKKDDPEDEYSDGSSSNPSVDNFDLKDIYEKIYEINNAEELQHQKEEANMRFMHEINEGEFVDQQKMIEMIDDAFSGKKRSVLRSSMNKNKFLKQGSTIKPNNKNVKVDNSLKGTSINIISINQQSQQTPDHDANSIKNQKYIRRSPYHPQFYNTGLNIEQQILKKSNTQSPMQKEEYDTYPLTTHSIFEHAKGDRNAISQGKAYAYNQKFSTYANSQNMSQISSLHFKLFQQSQLNNYGKKESIQQVIKDCFITKKIGNSDNPASKFVSPSPQKQKANRTFYQHVEGQRMHSFNNFKNLAAGQPQNTIQFIKKQKKQALNNFRSPHIQPQKNETLSNKTHSASNHNFKDKLMTYDDYSDHQQQQQQLEQSEVNPPSTAQESASSLFMRYVKSKLVKKIKTEQLPQQVANKYMDIYRELIDKEAQRKLEDQEFLRLHQNQSQNTAMSTSASVMNSRNKSQTRSEQKSRHRNGKAKPNPQPLLQQQQVFDEGVLINQKQYKGTTGQERKSMDEPFAQSQSHNSSIPYSIMINSNIGVNNHFQKKNPNRSVYLLEPTDDTYQLEQSEHNPTRFPIINNFSSTLDYKKRSRDINNEQKQLKNGQNSGYEVINPQTLGVYVQYQEQPYAYGRGQEDQRRVMADQNKQSHQKSSIDSSIDDEMLDKIKNIYTEMRKNTHHSGVYHMNPQQLPQQKQLASNNGKMGSLRQKRLMMKAVNSQSSNVDIVGETYAATQNAKTNIKLPTYQVNGNGVVVGTISKSVNQSMNPPSFSDRKQ